MHAIPPGRTGTLNRAADRVADFVERHAGALVAALLLLYTLTTVLRAAAKPFWNDEIIALYVAGLPSISAVWRASLAGVDGAPPLHAFLLHAVHATLGDGEVAVRVPAWLGFGTFLLALFAFTRRRLGTIYGFITVLFLLKTGAYPYAYEARPYGILLGLAGLALLSWQEAATGRHRRLGLAGLFLGLFLGIANHYYAVFAIVALGSGELARTMERRRLDGAIAAALVLPFAAFIPLLPVIRAVRTRLFAHSWAPPHPEQILGTYGMLLRPALVTLVAVTIVVGVLRLTRSDPPIPSRTKRGGFNPHELAALGGFVLIPAAAVLTAMAETGTYTFRYGIPAIIGLSVFFTIAVRRLSRGGTTTAVLLLLMISLAVLKDAGRAVAAPKDPRAAVLAMHPLLLTLPETPTPVAVGDPHAFIQARHYLPRAIADRLVYLNDPEAALQYTGDDTAERNLSIVGEVVDLDVPDYRPFILAHRSFWTYETRPRWLIRRLEEDGAALTLIRRASGSRLCRVVFPTS